MATVRLSNGELLVVAATVIPAAPLPPIVTRPDIDADRSLAGVWAMQDPENMTSATRAGVLRAQVLFLRANQLGVIRVLDIAMSLRKAKVTAKSISACASTFTLRQETFIKECGAGNLPGPLVSTYLSWVPEVSQGFLGAILGAGWNGPWPKGTGMKETLVTEPGAVLTGS